VVPKEEVTTSTMYDEHLLAYYFCGLRDLSPIVRVKNFYNVLEYFFDQTSGHREIDQLLAVLRKLYSVKEFKTIMARARHRGYKAEALRTSSSEVIPALPPSSSDPIADYNTRLYALRNACVHSKQRRKGQVPPRVAPSLRGCPKDKPAHFRRSQLTGEA
jgi:hypothetical protein